MSSPTSAPEFPYKDEQPAVAADTAQTADPIEAHHRPTDKRVGRRDILRMAIAALAASQVPAAITSTARAQEPEGTTDPDIDKDEEVEMTVDIEKATEIFAEEIAQMYPSKGNKKSMKALAGWFVWAVARGFMPKAVQKVTGLGNNALHEATVFSPTSGIAMCASEMLGRLPFLHHSDNEYDREAGHHEHDEVYGNMYLVAVMAYLGHFAEQGIKVSPEVDQIIEDVTTVQIKEFSATAFNVVSGGWNLDESAERPDEEAEKAEWEEHMKKAKRDMQKAATDMLSYSAATSVLIFPTVYGTSKFSQNSERKYPIVAYEYYVAKAHLEGLKGEAAEAYAMEKANKAFEQFFAFKLAFVDNIIAGLGVDGPCIPVFLKIFAANGVEGLKNYFKMMVPNIMKWTGVGLTQLELSIFGTSSDFVGLAGKSIGETLVNGVSINVAIIVELMKKMVTDGQLDKNASFVQQVLTRPSEGNGNGNGDTETATSDDVDDITDADEGELSDTGDIDGKEGNGDSVDGDEIAKRIEEYIASQARISFSFDLNLGSFADELKNWVIEAVSHLRHPLAKMGEAPAHRSKLYQKTAFSQDIHAVMLERYAVVTTWDTQDTDAKREIIEELLADDPVVSAQFAGSSADDLMDDENFRSFVSAHLSQTFRTNSPVFEKLSKNADGTDKYPALKEDDKAHVVQLAVRDFVKSLRMGKTHVHPGYHPDAGKEVFGALSGQLVGAAIAASMAKWLLMKEVDLGKDLQVDIRDAFDLTFNSNDTQEAAEQPLLDLVDIILDTQNSKRGELSPRVAGQLNADKTKLKVLVGTYQTAKLSGDKKAIEEAMHEVVATFSGMVANIYRIPRPDEMPGNLKMIYAVTAGMTPIADNIAAVLFGISASKTSIEDVFGPEMLEMKVVVPVIPGLPLNTEMTVQEVLIIMAAMLGINLGNGSLWGNGVQLGEKLQKIVGVKSRNIGDLKIETAPATSKPGKFTMFTNPYAFVADAWTLADVNALLDGVTGQMLEAAALPKAA